MTLHYSNLTPEQQSVAVLALIDYWESWEIENATYKVDDNGMVFIADEVLH